MPSGSFSFCGIDISSLGLNYAPEISNTFVYRPADMQTHIETFDSHNGGYYYGSWTEPKEFILRCFFEEKNINRGIMSKIYSLFKVGKSGKLIFEKRPWCYYYATVTDPIQADFTNYLNGLITIKMKAMYPFARSDIFTNLRSQLNHDTLISNSAVFDKPGMELPTEYDITGQKSLILVNNGTERAALGIAISGDVGDGIIIRNETTGQECKMVAITKEKTTNINKYVLVDPISGKTTITNGETKELAFKYHERGFLELEPSYPAERDLYVNYLGGNFIEVKNMLTKNLTGKYIFVKDAWHKIVDQPDKHSIIVDEHITDTGSERTMVILANEITVMPVTTIDVHLRFIFKPTYA